MTSQSRGVVVNGYAGSKAGWRRRSKTRGARTVGVSITAASLLGASPPFPGTRLVAVDAAASGAALSSSS